MVYIQDSNGNKTELLLNPTGDTVPIGFIGSFGGETMPTGWLKCNGSKYLKTDYPELYNAVGNYYNQGDEGEIYFRVPDARKMFLIGAVEGDGTGYSLGSTGGEEEHTLTISEMPEHSHGIQVGWTTGDTDSIFYNRNNATNSLGTQNRGGSQPHNNMPPYLAVNIMIKAKQSVGIVGDKTDDINDKNDNAWVNAKTVKDYVDKKNTYSTDEIVIGTYLGKPLYRKIISAKYSENDTIISNIDTLVNCNGTAILGGIKRLLPYYEWYNNNSYRATIEQHNNELKAKATYIGQPAEATFKITLEYTKTTDEG